MDAPRQTPVPDIEDGGCDVCDDPNCYRNQVEPATAEQLAYAAETAARMAKSEHFYR